jgi:hypothetical protein
VPATLTRGCDNNGSANHTRVTRSLERTPVRFKHSENPVPSRPARLRVTPTSRGGPTPLRARPQNRHPRDVRLVGGKWECANCGAELDGVPKDSQPQVVMAHRSGAPSIRILKIGGAEIHRCEIESESA